MLVMKKTKEYVIININVPENVRAKNNADEKVNKYLKESGRKTAGV